MRARFAISLSALLAIGCSGQIGFGSGVGGNGAGGNGAVPTAGHPRLFFTAADVDKLRARAVAGNPLWTDGLSPLLDKQAAAADAGTGDPFAAPGCGSYGNDACEAYAELFAFGALVHPDAATRAHLLSLAHTLVMKVVDAYLGGTMGSELADFTEGDRGRWNGESLSLAVDWAYASFTSDEKARIHDAFVMLCGELTMNGYHHPDPTLTNDDAALVADRKIVRWAGNNYWSAAMRNIGLMSLALDGDDDPDGMLAGYLKSATKGWLFVFDNLSRHECQGGLCGEGPEYEPQTLSYAAELMLALRTSGRNDPALYGPQVVRENNPFWSDLVPAWAATLSPATIDFGGGAGPMHQPAWNGDGQHLYAADAIALVGSISLDARAAADPTLADAAAWVAINGAPQADGNLATRLRSPGRLGDAVLYFLVVDGTAALPADPRPSWPTSNFAPGMGWVSARSDWSTAASWFTWHTGWQSIDHQHADANDFAFYRKGEWLTKETTGYQVTNPDVIRSDSHNAVSVENAGPTAHSDWRLDLWQNGSQMLFVADGDPVVLAHAFGADYAYAEGDATPLYNSQYESSATISISDVKHVSRAIVWLSPDRVVIYDRAETGSDGRFKRVWFHFPSLPRQDNGARVTAMSAGGQQLSVSVILPAGASIVPSAWSPTDEAMYDTMSARSVTEATAPSVRFLHLVEGADGGATPTTATAITTVSGPAVDGAIVGDVAVVFARDVGTLTAPFSFSAPGATRVLVTGLTAGASFDVTRAADVVTVSPGSGQAASDGVLDIH